MPSLKPALAVLTLASVLGAGRASAIQRLTLNSTAALRGQSATISLGYAGDGSILGVQLDVTFDSSVLESPTVSIGTGLAGQALRSSLISPGRVRLVIYSPLPGGAFAVGNGEVAQLTFHVAGTAPVGMSELSLAGVVLGNMAAVAVPPTEVHGGAVEVLADPGSFYTLVPCRVVDTRNGEGPFGGPPLSELSVRSFALVNVCGIPATARALSVNVTVVQPSANGDLRIFPSDVSVPLTSTINFEAGQTRANNAIVGLSELGELNVRNDAAGSVHLVIDVNGYFQ
jgi:hypothetical protein